jgi:hypothetical protein
MTSGKGAGMKKAVLFCLVLWGAADAVAAAAAVLPEGLPQTAGARDSRICLDLMDLGGSEGGGEDSMELPPMKGELKPAAETGSSLKLKTPTEPSSSRAYSGEPLTIPEPDASPGLSPLILSQPGTNGEIEKLPMKPLGGGMDTVPDAPGVSVGQMPSELKSLEPLEAPGTGLKMSTSGRAKAPAPFESPEIPLLADESPGLKDIPDDSTRGALSLKPLQPASRRGEPKTVAAYPVTADLGSPDQPFGNQLDEKLIAIYEKFYKTRK